LLRSHVNLLSRETSQVVVVDMQEKLVAAIPSPETFIAGSRLLVEGALACGVPLTVTEQYPQGLGETIPILRALWPENVEIRSKMTFSAVPVLNWPDVADAVDDRIQVILAGTETHLCVLQTALDLTSLGYQVFVAVDAVGARRTIDHETALRRLEANGVHLVTVESVLFEWCESAASPCFAQVFTAVKARG